MSENREIPKGWLWAKVKDIALNIQYGYTESSSKIKVGPKFLRITDIQDNQINWETVPFCIIKDEEKKKYLLKDGDLVFARTGATVGKSFLIKGTIPESIYASYLIRLRFIKEISDKYVWSFFQSADYWSQITNKQVGIGQPNVNGTKLGQLSICIPPLHEQHRIVAKIEELLSSLDKGIENLKTAQQQLKVYRQAVLKWAFEGKLTNKNVKDGELPGGWKKVNLGEISEKIQIGPFGSQLHKEDYMTGGIPLINPMHFKDGIIKSDSFYSISTKKRDSLPNYILNEGDIIMGRRGEMGRYGLVGKNETGWLCGTGSLYIRPKRKVANSLFLLHCLKEQIVKKYLEENAAGTTMANLNSKIVNNIPICIPPIAEQYAIVAEIESRLSVCDKIEESIEQSLTQSETLRQSILKKAFEGKLVPQDPNDEPAGALLERIRAERVVQQTADKNMPRRRGASMAAEQQNINGQKIKNRIRRGQ